MAHKVRFLLSFAGLVIIVVMLMGFASRRVRVDLKGGGFLTIAPAPFWCRLCGSRCDIAYEVDGGKRGSLTLFHGFLDYPILIVPSTNRGSFFCLYGYDPGLCLLRVDTTQVFKQFPPGTGATGIIISSSWKIEKGELADWEQVYSILKEMPSALYNHQQVPGLDIGIARFNADQNALTKRVRQLIDALPYQDRRSRSGSLF